MERSILVVEDSPTQAAHLRLLLEGEGYRVDVVTDGRQGLERAQATLPDLIISDVVMPEMDGYAFCRAVKSAERTRRIPFVLVTERNAPADVIKGLQHGADNFITKPFEDAYLLERVRRIFENLELRRRGHLDVEVILNAGGQQLIINTDKQQIMELLLATLEDLVRMNGRLVEAQRIVEDYARDLEGKVRERTTQLLQTEKLAAMGTLLAGVAHELNNPLAVVVGRAALLEERLREGPLAEQTHKLAQAAEQCARIVKNFLALARQHPPERQTVNLNRIVEDAVELLAYPLRMDGVEITLSLNPTLPALWADPHQLHQVVVNLVTNAQQAMHDSTGPRRITLTTQHEARSGRVVLGVADTGPGIAPELQGRIFEPFFTTKGPGKGTGLGLSLCQGLVEEHGGTIGVRSEPGGGAIFRIELPVQAIPARAGEPATAELDPLPRRSILVVDDEPEVAAVLADVLSTDGHEVRTAPDGAAALRELTERTYDVIFSDLRMPTLDGPGLYRELERRDLRQARRIVFLTGDTLSPEIRAFLEQVAAPTVNKPFALAEIRRALRLVEGA